MTRSPPASSSVLTASHTSSTPWRPGWVSTVLMACWGLSHGIRLCWGRGDSCACVPFPPSPCESCWWGCEGGTGLWAALAVPASHQSSVTLSRCRLQCCLTLPCAELPAVCARALPLPAVHPGQGWSPSEHQRLPQPPLGRHHGTGAMGVLAVLGQGGGSPFPAGDPAGPEAPAMPR